MDKVIRDIRRRIELNEPLRTIDIGQIVRNDANADRIVLEMLENGQPVQLDGYSVTGMFLNAIGLDVPIEGEIDGNTITATLGKGCYAVRGTAGGFIRVANSDASVIKTVIRFTADVLSDGSGKIYDPDSVIGSVAELLAKIEAMETATADGLAAAQEARDAGGEAVQTAQTAAQEAKDTAQQAGEEAKAVAQEAADKADAAREAIQGDLGVLKDTKAPAIEVEASGSIVTVDDAAAMPVHGLVSQIVPVQAAGTPTPENPLPISGWDAVNVTRAGKNLYNSADVETNKGLNTTTGEAVDKAGVCVSPFIPINGAVSCSFPTDVDLSVIAFYDKDKAFLTANFLRTSPTVLENTSAAFIRFHTPTVSRNAVQIELGGVAATYEAHQGQTLSAALPETVYGGVKDWTTGALLSDGVLLTFDGTESWGQLNDGENRYYYFELGALNTVNAVEAASRCSHFAYANILSANTVTGFRVVNSPGYNRDQLSVRPGIETVTDIASWKAWLADQAAAGTPLQVSYTLKEPKTIQLTPQRMDMLKGTNNVWSDTGDTEFVYVADTKMYIDKKISELVTLALANE